MANLQPLASQFKIVNPDGTPTEYFIRWAQQKQIDIQGTLTPEQTQELVTQALLDYDTANQLQAGTGISITPDGQLSNDPTIALNAGVNDLTDVDTATTPPTNGQTMVWDATAGLWKPGTISGGGGGGGPALLGEIVSTGGEASLSLPVSLTGLTEVRILAASRKTGGSGNDIGIRFNGDTGYNYGYRRWNMYGNTASGSDTFMDIGTTGGATVQSFSSHEVNCFNINTGQHPVFTGVNGTLLDFGGSFIPQTLLGVWKSTAPITSVQMFPTGGGSFVAGSFLRVYGS